MGALAGKAVIITGAGQGIGAACAKAVARRGASVVVNDIDGARAETVAEAIAQAGGKAIANTSSVATMDGSASLVEACVRGFGRIDGLVNNAGVIFPDLVEDAKERDIRLTVEVNVLGPIFCAQHAIRQMKKQGGGGSIVNVCSGSHTGSPTLSVYAGSKGAVASLTYSWAMEMAGTGIRVNALLPMAETQMRNINDSYRSSRGLSPHASPVVPPEANAPVVEFLLSDHSRDMTGQMLNSEGSRLALYVHPGRQYPVLERPTWTMEAIAEAYCDDFSKRLLPLGTHIIRTEIAD